MYNEIPHQPIGESLNSDALKEKIQFSLNFMEHIFGEQLELGLDYIKIFAWKTYPNASDFMFGKQRAFYGKIHFYQMAQIHFRVEYDLH